MKIVNHNKKIAVKTDKNDCAVWSVLLENEPDNKKLVVQPGLSVYVMSDGTAVELYGTGSCFPDYLFSSGNIVVSFKVSDISSMVLRLQNEGAELLGEIQLACSTYQYCHIRTSNGTIIGLYEQH